MFRSSAIPALRLVSKRMLCRELIEGKERVVVMGHSIGDADSFGASVGIYRIAKALNRKAHIVVDEVNARYAR